MKSTIILLTVSSVALVVVCGIGRLKKKDIIVETIRDVIVVFVSAFLALAITYYQEEKETALKIKSIISIIANKEYDELISNHYILAEVDEDIDFDKACIYIESWAQSIIDDEDDIIQELFRSELILGNIDFSVYSKIITDDNLSHVYKKRIEEQLKKDDIDYIELLDQMQKYYKEKINTIKYLDAYEINTDLDLNDKEEATEIESSIDRNYEDFNIKMTHNINSLKWKIDPAAEISYREVDRLDGTPAPGVSSVRVGPASSEEVVEDKLIDEVE